MGHVGLTRAHYHAIRPAFMECLLCVRASPVSSSVHTLLLPAFPFLWVLDQELTPSDLPIPCLILQYAMRTPCQGWGLGGMGVLGVSRELVTMLW